MTAAPPRPAEVTVEPTPVREPDPAPAPVAVPPGVRTGRGRRPSRARRALPSVAQAIGLSFTVLAGLLVVLVLHLFVFANLAESRAQENLFKTFRGQLAQAVAPVGPAAVGAPVAIVEVPRLHLRAVVVEGTASGQLLQGPGHRRDTPLPGQPGTSVIYGRGLFAGQPFAGLDHLQPGDQILVTTGQADHITFSVVGSRDSRTPPAPVSGGRAPRLTLLGGAGGQLPDHAIVVSAVLTSAPLDAAGQRPVIGPAEAAFGVDGSALLTVALWLQVLVVLTAVTTYLYLRGPRWAVWLVSTPVVLAVLWNIAENLERMLPNVV